MTDFTITGFNLTCEYVRAEGARQGRAAIRFVFAVACLGIIIAVSQWGRAVELLMQGDV